MWDCVWVGLWPLGRWRELFVLGRMFRLQNIRIPKYSAFALLQPDGAAVNSPSAKNCLRACAPCLCSRMLRDSNILSQSLPSQDEQFPPAVVWLAYNIPKPLSHGCLLFVLAFQKYLYIAVCPPHPKNAFALRHFSLSPFRKYLHTASCSPAIKKRFCTAAFFLFHELRAPHCHHTPPALRLSHSAGSVLEDSRENVSVLFSCDCAGMLETLSILPHRQGAQALRQFLAEGELTAAPSGCESVYAESLGFLAFRNRNKKTGQTHSPGVRAATFPICPRSHPPQHQKKTRHAPSLSACLVPSFILSSPAPIFLNSPSSHPRPSTKCSL